MVVLCLQPRIAGLAKNVTMSMTKLKKAKARVGPATRTKGNGNLVCGGENSSKVLININVALMYFK